VHRRKLLLAPLLCCRVTSVGRRVRRHHRLRVVPDYEQNRTPLLCVVAFESPLLQSNFSFSWARRVPAALRHSHLQRARLGAPRTAAAAQRAALAVERPQIDSGHRKREKPGPGQAHWARQHGGGWRSTRLREQRLPLGHQLLDRRALLRRLRTRRVVERLACTRWKQKCVHEPAAPHACPVRTHRHHTRARACTGSPAARAAVPTRAAAPRRPPPLSPQPPSLRLPPAPPHERAAPPPRQLPPAPPRSRAAPRRPPLQLWPRAPQTRGEEPRACAPAASTADEARGLRSVGGVGAGPVPGQMWRRSAGPGADVAAVGPGPGADVAAVGADVAQMSAVPGQTWHR
jgi:hypothetical protein